MDNHNLIILSDVHLGSDLVHHARPDAPARARSGKRRDRALATLFDWYRKHRRNDRPWKLVIAGDFVDFVGMSVPPQADGIRTAPNAEELALGLGGAVDHAVHKLRRVALHHRRVFRSLARFIAAGNTLVVVRGNHDVDFHWPAVQDAFLRQLALYAVFHRGRVEFCPWFYYEEGRVYVEHGHQYDRYCAHENLLHPVCPSDPRRSWSSLSDVMLRYVVRPTRGLRESGHEHAGLSDYLRFAAGLGIRGMIALGERFFRAVGAALAVWRDHFSEGARHVRAQHERRMAELAMLKEISIERLKQLAALQRPPVTRSLLLILAGVMLDRVLLLLAGVIAVLGALLVFDHLEHAALSGVGIVMALAALGWLWARSRATVDPSNELRECATRVAKVFPAAFVVMGHTHLPEVRTADDGSTYVNLGAWAPEESDDDALDVAAQTHLVVLDHPEGAVAELLVWDPKLGPRHFVSGYAPSAVGARPRVGGS